MVTSFADNSATVEPGVGQVAAVLFDFGSTAL